MNADIDITGVVLHTERLILRPFELGDLEDFYDYCKVPGVGEMAGWPHHKSIEDSKFVLNLFLEGRKTFAVVYEGKVIGSVGIEKYNEEFFPELKDYKARELGFVLSKDYWGKGIMPKAAKEVIKYCFNVVGLDILVCGHYSFNQQSARCQEKLGFVHYKQERKHYSEIWGREDQGWYSLLCKKEEDAVKFQIPTAFLK